MGIVASVRKLLSSPTNSGRTRMPAGRVLDVPSGYNIRELGGYVTPGGTTVRHRYLRSGGTDQLSDADMRYLQDYGVTHVLDLRGDFERPARTCRFARQDAVTWLNVPLFDYDISDPQLIAVADDARGNYLVSSYLTMLANHRAIHRIFRFFARANANGPTCTLFHCAAGMDRTGITAFLLLGLVGASRATIIADYTYSFGNVDDINRAVDSYVADAGLAEDDLEQLVRMQTIDAVYRAVVDAYGTVRDFLLACDLNASELDLVAASLLDSSDA